MARPRLAKPHEHVIAIVHSPRALRPADCSQATLRQYRRIAKLPQSIVDDLDGEDAPLHVRRWIAWGRGLAGQLQRLELALHLRHSIDRDGDGWLDARRHGAALRVLETARAEARAGGGAPPAVAALPLEAYQGAIKRLPASRPRVSAPPPTREQRPLSSAEKRKLTELLRRAGLGAAVS
jgi:hypothetical protein